MSDQSMFEQFQAFMAMQEAAKSAPDAVSTKVLADAPKPKTQSKRAETVAKVASVERNVTAMLVTQDGASDHAAGAPLPEGVAFLVLAQSAGDKPAIFTNGARIMAVVDGKPQKSWPSAAARAYPTVADSVLAAIGTVEHRALLGAHRPPKTSVEAES